MAVFNREHAKELLESQIVNDANDGDTTVLGEIISSLSDEQIWGSLSDANQEFVRVKIRENQSTKLK